MENFRFTYIFWKFYETINIRKTEIEEVSKRHITIIWLESKFWTDNETGKSIFSKKNTFF